MSFKIYALCHPDETVFYIGQTQSNYRFQSHLRSAKANEQGHRFAVIREILEKGEQPIFKVLDTADALQDALAKEAALIAHYGIENLTNVREQSTSGVQSVHKRFQLYVNGEQWAKLASVARSTGLSIAEHIRRAIDEYLLGK